MKPKLASIDRMKHAAMTFSAVLALAGLSGPAGQLAGGLGLGTARRLAQQGACLSRRRRPDHPVRGS